MRLQLLLTITLFLGFWGLSQNINVVYRVDFQPQKQNDTIKTEYMMLKIQDKRSAFFPVKAGKKSSSEEEFDYLNFQIYIQNSYLRYYGKFNSLNFFYQEDLSNNWKLVENSKQVWNGYTTYKAKIKLDNREWTALYAPEIPISYGPYKFVGLPGLILKVQSDDGEYNFEMSEIKKVVDKETLSTPLANYQKLSKKKLHQYIEKFMADPAGQNILTVNSFGDSYDYVFKGRNSEEYLEMKKFMTEVISRYDNPIDKKTFILVY